MSEKRKEATEMEGKFLLFFLGHTGNVIGHNRLNSQSYARTHEWNMGLRGRLSSESVSPSQVGRSTTLEAVL